MNRIIWAYRWGLEWAMISTGDDTLPLASTSLKFSEQPSSETVKLIIYASSHTYSDGLSDPWFRPEPEVSWVSISCITCHYVWSEASEGWVLPSAFGILEALEISLLSIYSLRQPGGVSPVTNRPVEGQGSIRYILWHSEYLKATNNLVSGPRSQFKKWYQIVTSPLILDPP